MEKRNIIVVGASAGGFEAIKQLIDRLPAKMDASIFVVWHMSPDVRGILPEVLNRLQKMTASTARDNEAFGTGHVYVAPPDHHLLVEKDGIRVTRGPKENRFRPAVDPLFRSAAYAHGARVTGIILSGALDDGTAGLWAVKHQGGIAIVQDPDEAEVPSMPQNAINAVNVDHVVAIGEMPALLMRLVQEEVEASPAASGNDEQLKTEIRIAMEEEALDRGFPAFGQLTPFTCPECHGVLSALAEGGRVRFRCHTGHAFSADSLLASITENIEQSTWSAVRSVRESVMLLNHMGDHFAEVNQPKLAAMYFRKAKEAETRAEILRHAAMRTEQLSTGSIRRQTDEEQF